MGIIIGKFRKKKSTYDILEKLDQEITSIEEFGRSTEQTRKKIIGRFVLLAILVYVILAFALYIYYHKISANQKLICVIPLIGFPLIIWIIKRFLTWYYHRKISKNEKKLVSLKDEKKKILDNVMETETYKVAKKILDKFGNEVNKKPLSLTTSEMTPATNTAGTVIPTSIRPYQTGLRQRNLGASAAIRDRLSPGGLQTPFGGRQLLQSAVTPSLALRSVAMLPAMGPMPGTPLPLPRRILPKDRSVLDKMVDYLVGDGPSNRYALICSKCNSHNGMALKEEFEYLSFRCCYCSAFNPARKKKPTGPKFLSGSPSKALPAPESSDSDKNSMSDSETESAKPLKITELRTDSPNTEKTSDFEKLSDLELKSSDSVNLDNEGKVLPGSPMEISDDSSEAKHAEGEPFLHEKDTVTRAESENETLNE